MEAQKFMIVISNLLGIDFSTLLAANVWIVCCQLLFNANGWYYAISSEIKDARVKNFNIYFFIGVYQTVVQLMLQNIFLYRALRMKSLQKKISSQLSGMTKGRRKEWKFLISFAVIIAVRIAKLLMITGFESRVFIIHLTFAELCCSCNDFLFVYYFDALSERLIKLRVLLKLHQQTNKSRETVLKAIVDNFWIKRDILRKYQLELFLNITYNFGQLVIDFYWIVMRITYGYLNTLNRKFSFKICD